MYKICFLIVVIFFLSGCDFYFGVNRSSPASQIPELGCVERVIKSVPKVEFVNYKRQEGSRPLNGFTIEEPDIIESFTYSVEGEYVTLYFRSDYKKEVSYSHFYMDINRKPEKVDIVLPIMREIDEKLKKLCAASDNLFEIKEKCWRVDC